jgi:hypothetical protein
MNGALEGSLCLRQLPQLKESQTAGTVEVRIGLIDIRDGLVAAQSPIGVSEL